MTEALITGIGHYLPPRQVTNEKLPVNYPVDDASIVKRTGIHSRHYVEGKVYTSDLAQRAAEDALKSAWLTSSELDCIITATLSPDYCFPGIGVYLQHTSCCATSSPLMMFAINAPVFFMPLMSPAHLSNLLSIKTFWWSARKFTPTALAEPKCIAISPLCSAMEPQP